MYPDADLDRNQSLIINFIHVPIAVGQSVTRDREPRENRLTVCNQPLRPTQPSTLSGTENEHRPKCGDDLRLGSKGRHGSFHLWINVWVAGKTR